MPTSAHARCLPLTYTADAGSSPTSTVASPGTRPVRSRNTSTCSATSARTRAAIALPSMMLALTAWILRVGPAPRRRAGRWSASTRARPSAAASTAADRRVLGHQLALGAVAGEAHDDHAVRLDARHDALAEGRVNDVLAEAKCARDGRPRAARARPLAARGAVGGARATAGDQRARTATEPRRDRTA